MRQPCNLLCVDVVCVHAQLFLTLLFVVAVVSVGVAFSEPQRANVLQETFYVRNTVTFLHDSEE